MIHFKDSNAMLSNVCQANRGVCLDGMGPVHREKHQIDGERAATGCTLPEERSTTDDAAVTMLESLNWVSLASRRAEAKLVLLYRCTNNLADVTPSALKPFTRIEAYNLSEHYQIMEQMRRTSRVIL